jgi:N-hydroxyarylamine O-acetyltransferase
VSDWSDRYLRLLGLEPETPSLDWLRRFGSAHLETVPFCNVTAILRRHASQGEGVPALDAEAQLVAWEQRKGGGVCFEVAEMVWRLLSELGFEAHIVLGEITFPASHQAVVVRLREGPYLVDLGCGEPLAEPIPLIRESEFQVAGLSYRFRPDLGTLRCVQDRLVDNEWTPLCEYNLQPATDEERDVGFQRHHIPGETWVIGGISLVRFVDGEVLALRSKRFTRYGAADKQSMDVLTSAELERIVREELGWPELPIGEALAALDSLQGRPDGNQPLRG